MMIGFCLGVAVTSVVLWYVWWRGRREILRLDEEKQRLHQERTIVVEFMHRLAESIAEGVDREKLYREVVHTGLTSTGALSACVFERKGNRLRGVAVEGLFPPHRPLPAEVRQTIGSRTRLLEYILRSEVFEVGEGLVGTVAETGKGILIQDAREDPRVIKHEDPALEVRSVIVVPISFRNRNIAVLAIVNSADGLTFGESEFSLAESLGEQAALALQNLDLMAVQLEQSRLENDLALASNIQGMLLPKQFPKDPRLAFGAIYLPAQQVGGDFYDAFELGDGRIGVVVADVSGKGIPASLVMAICQSNLRHFARACDSPAEALRQLNGILHEETGPEMFVTVLYAVIDRQKHEVTLARAGHELPLLCHHSQVGTDGSTTEFIRSEGMAVGMVPGEIFDASIDEVVRPFLPGDVLLLYTDGVTEASNEKNIEFGNERLQQVVVGALNEFPREINQQILDRVSSFAGSSGYADDFTLLTIQYLPNSGREEGTVVEG